MMNLDLAIQGHRVIGRSKICQYCYPACRHYPKFFARQNNSAYHVIMFDPITGERKIGLTLEGYAHESTWVQRQAWELYGYATVYRYIFRRNGILIWLSN